MKSSPFVFCSYDEVLYESASDLQPKHLVSFLLKLWYGTGCWSRAVGLTPPKIEVRVCQANDLFVSQPPRLFSTQRAASERKPAGCRTGTEPLSLCFDCKDVLA